MKYGKYEFERSYLLDNNCLKDVKTISVKKIRDKYLEGTTLRLREVVENKETIYKLTQKEPLNPGITGVLKINTLYLTKPEFDKFYSLEGFEIKKVRHIIEMGHIRIGIDKIILNKKSFFIAEVEFESEVEMNAFSMPLSYIKEITGMQKYSGYAIAKEYSKKQKSNKH